MLFSSFPVPGPRRAAPAVRRSPNSRRNGKRPGAKGWGYDQVEHPMGSLKLINLSHSSQEAMYKMLYKMLEVEWRVETPWAKAFAFRLEESLGPGAQLELKLTIESDLTVVWCQMARLVVPRFWGRLGQVGVRPFRWSIAIRRCGEPGDGPLPWHFGLVKYILLWRVKNSIDEIWT